MCFIVLWPSPADEDALAAAPNRRKGTRGGYIDGKVRELNMDLALTHYLYHSITAERL
jgi:hypothetical protein